MSKHVTFVERALKGKIVDVDEEIDNEMVLWHASDSKLSLHEWLGMTRDEYALFVERPEALRFILAGKKYRTSVKDLLARDSTGFALAARGDLSPQQMAEITQWLKTTNRI